MVGPVYLTKAGREALEAELHDLVHNQRPSVIARIKAANPTLEGQIAAVIRLVQEDVRYLALSMGEGGYVPATADETWRSRYGDCKDKAYLSVLLLRRLGLDAEPALVSTRIGRRLDRQLPAASAFNHVIVRLRLKGKSYWLDPTLSQQRGNNAGQYIAHTAAGHAGITAVKPGQLPLWPGDQAGMAF